MHLSQLRSLDHPARTRLYAIPLRLMVGYGFMEQGSKAGSRPESFVNILHAIGVPEPSLARRAYDSGRAHRRLRGAHRGIHSASQYSMARSCWCAIFTVHLPYGVQLDQVGER